MTKRLTVSQANIVGINTIEAYTTAHDINKYIYDGTLKFNISQLQIVIAEVRQYLNIIETDVASERRKGKRVEL